jgi:DNA end-binding protein Ku
LPERRRSGKGRDAKQQPQEQAAAASVRSFWSGTISFGLVSIPVDLVTATRAGDGTGTRMLDADSGEPLGRRYYCPEHDVALDSEEIVRGYEIEKDEFVIVKDAELEAIAPRKSRDIDLVRFVDASAIDPRYFRKGYFLLPSGESSKAYHLLAETMQRSNRAGIATFVMRGHEYLVAILAERGILRAETLRFGDELRSPEQVGVQGAKKPPAARVTQMIKAIKRLEKRSLDPAELGDPSESRVLALARKKLERGEDVVELSEPAASAEEAPGAQVVDLMELIKRRMGAAASGSQRTRDDHDLQAATKQELLERARQLGIEGRSRMTKTELARAIKKAS